MRSWDCLGNIDRDLHTQGTQGSASVFDRSHTCKKKNTRELNQRNWELYQERRTQFKKGKTEGLPCQFLCDLESMFLWSVNHQSNKRYELNLLGTSSRGRSPILGGEPRKNTGVFFSFSSFDFHLHALVLFLWFFVEGFGLGRTRKIKVYSLLIFYLFSRVLKEKEIWGVVNFWDMCSMPITWSITWMWLLLFFASE